jgi:hypothetical protein
MERLKKAVIVTGVVLTLCALPFLFGGMLFAVVKAPSVASDVWRTYVLRETWALWTDYGAEVTYDPYGSAKGRPQCLREVQAECRLEMVKRQAYADNTDVAEMYKICMESHLCGSASDRPTEYICLPRGEKPVAKITGRR